MARTTNEFGGGEIVPSIEAITGIQAPVMADFVQYDNITVRNDHGERRFQQSLTNNLKSSSGIERIPFNGIDELDTEQGPNGETIHALNTGDSRIRFVGNGWVNITSNDGTRVETQITGDYIEVTFFGTALNLLCRPESNGNWEAVVDGGTAFNIEPTATSSVLGGQNVKQNIILPVTSGLSAEVHTVRITRRAPDSGTDQRLFLYGCEVINENPLVTGSTVQRITQQKGADFDGRVSTLNGVEFPIAPDNTIVPSFNSTTTTVEALANTINGARVLNYLTSGGQYKQSFTTIAAPINEVASGADYTVLFDASGSGSLTIPASAQSFKVIAFGGGGTGGTGAGDFAFGSGGGGGGGARTEVTYTRDNNNMGTTLAITDSVGTSIPLGGMASVGNTTVTAGGSLIVTSGGGAAGDSGTNSDGGDGGTGGTAVAETASVTGWTIDTNSTDLFNGGTGDDGGNSPGNGGNVGGGVGTAPLSGNEGSGGGSQAVVQNGNPGVLPGGAGTGGFFGLSGVFSPGVGGAGTIGRLYIEFTATSGLTITTTGTVTSVSGGGADLGAPAQRFGATDHRNQEIIRRINFREFGANNSSDFSTLAGNGSDRAFTLADGTTTLVGNDVFTHPENGETGVTISQTTGFLTLSFVGTGLDITNNRSASLATHNVRVDGLSIGTLSGVQPVGVIPIVSGLAYGTHTVQFALENSSLERLSVVDFIIYGPKKPEIPTLDAGSLELSDYNIMADYVPTTVRGIEVEDFQPSKGTIVKPPLREVLYAGTISAASQTSDALFLNGIGFNGANSFLEYTFYGTDIDIVARTGSANFTVTVMLDGAAYTGAATVVTNTTTPSTWTPSTSTWQQGGAGFREILQINNLDLGVHTIRITGGGNFILSGLFFHSPIHINDDTLKVGSEGLNNLTIDPVVEEDEAVVLANLGEAKAWGSFSNNSTAFVRNSNNVAAILRPSIAGSENLFIYFDKPFKSPPVIVISSTGAATNGSLVIRDLRGGTGGPDNNGFRITSINITNPDYLSFAAYGELIDE